MKDGRKQVNEKEASEPGHLGEMHLECPKVSLLPLNITFLEFVVHSRNNVSNHRCIANAPRLAAHHPT